MAQKKTTEVNSGWIIPDQIAWLVQDGINMAESSMDELYVKAKIIGFNKQTKIATCKIEDNGKQVEVSTSRLQIRALLKETYQDMVNMDILNEPELLLNLRTRFDDNKIYTYVGPTLLAVNPFKGIEGMYSESNLKSYMCIVDGSSTDKGLYKKLAPHVFGLTAQAFKDLFENNKNQALVISGESGAGKTENTKYCMKFLTSLGQYMHSQDQKEHKATNETSIEDKILSCNPILEAFGNAKTVRNDNSSRFGKYVTMIVNKKDKSIIGAQIINYLLEKARITQQGQNERNFHIFYHFLKGAKKEVLQKNFLTYPVNFEEYEYLNKSKCYEVGKLDDIALFNEVEESFQLLGFSEVKDSIFACLSAILKIGNIKLDESTYTDQTPCKIKDSNLISQICKLLEVNQTDLANGITNKLRKVQKQEFLSPLTPSECINMKDTVAKYLYEKLFNWIVIKLNQIIIPAGYDPNNGLTGGIGLLDIYGFEVFKENGFEQFFINYTNEKLQQLYIQYVFKQEEQIFISEGLQSCLQYLTFTDNKPVIDLLDQPPNGIFNTLDDICQTKGDDSKFLNKIRQIHKNNKYFITPKIASKANFTIVHSAKEVEYTATNFTEKNVDSLQDLLVNTLSESKNMLFKTLFSFSNENADTKNKAKSLGGKFRVEMQVLMNDLMACDCHFIRCIKPNDEKKKDLFKTIYSLAQVRSLGVLESIKVRKQSYPIRKTFEQFYSRYAIAAQDFRSPQQLIDQNVDFKELTNKLFETIFKSQQTST
ncbi:myosin head, putative, partial [Ichthyophthirius multifiliis]